MLPKLLVVTPFPIHKPTKILRPESSGNHVIKLKWWRIVWMSLVSTYYHLLSILDIHSLLWRTLDSSTA